MAASALLALTVLLIGKKKIRYQVEKQPVEELINEMVI
jgi:hypothetical protein